MLTLRPGLMTGVPSTPRRISSISKLLSRTFGIVSALFFIVLLQGPMALAQAQGNLAPTAEPAGEANLKLPDLSSVDFLGMNGHNLLLIGLIFCVLGLLFGLGIYVNLKNLPVHRSMREVSELIYETCKTYLVTQGKFIALLWIFIAIVMVGYFGALMHYGANRVVIIVLFSIVGILGSYGVAWFGIRINPFANSRAAFASLGGKPFPTYEI